MGGVSRVQSRFRTGFGKARVRSRSQGSLRGIRNRPRGHCDLECRFESRSTQPRDLTWGIPDYTDAARAALETAPDGFKIALIHAAELADIAANAGFSLYLAGHTHGGQVCLPGGRPIITHLGRHRRYASGLWRHGSMTGYTTTGIGVSGLPVRFNSRGEVVLITLRRG